LNFNSITFIAFLFIALLAHRLLTSKTQQNTWLLALSYFFYACWDWRFLSLIIFTTAVDFIVAKKIVHYKKSAKAWLTCSIVVNMGILFFFKYFNFFDQNFVRFFNAIGFNVSPFALEILLPVGISFYTFQSLSYVIDVYRGQVRPIDNFITYALYIAFFPQLVAGPIERSTRLIPQLDQVRHCNIKNYYDGGVLIAVGLFKKCVVADGLAFYAKGILHPEQTQGIEMLVALYAFAFQVYGDFSGYSDMARGSAKCFGIDLMVNFNLPFNSKNIQEFWGKWHISLSEWIKSYVFFPLMRWKFLANRTSVNVFIAMTLTGIWHGAGSKYLLFGMYHGFLLVVFENTRRIRKQWRPNKQSPWLRPYQWLCQGFTFHLIVIAFAIFGCRYSSSLPDIAKALSHWHGINEGASILVLLYFTGLLTLMERVFPETQGQTLVNSGTKASLLRWSSLAIIFWAIIIHGVMDADPFIYFQF
jgi:alginate O-acetyltransferase complex protein AlgI